MNLFKVRFQITDPVMIYWLFQFIGQQIDLKICLMIILIQFLDKNNCLLSNIHYIDIKEPSYKYLIHLVY